MLIRKVPFIHAFKSFTFRKMRRTPGKARRIKYPYLTREEKKEVLIFEIKSADSTEWARWYLDISVEDEMRAHKITFILCIELSLKTSLNSMLSGEHRIACLGFRVISLCLFLSLISVKLWHVKTRVWPGWYGSVNLPDEHLVIIYKRTTYV